MRSVDLCLIVSGRQREGRDIKWENKSMASLGEKG